MEVLKFRESVAKVFISVSVLFLLIAGYYPTLFLRPDVVTYLSVLVLGVSSLSSWWLGRKIKKTNYLLSINRFDSLPTKGNVYKIWCKPLKEFVTVRSYYKGSGYSYYISRHGDIIRSKEAAESMVADIAIKQVGTRVEPIPMTKSDFEVLEFELKEVNNER